MHPEINILTSRPEFQTNCKNQTSNGIDHQLVDNTWSIMPSNRQENSKHSSYFYISGIRLAVKSPMAKIKIMS